MKKIVYSLAVLFCAGMLASCGNKNAENTESVAADTLVEVEETVAVDSNNDTTVAVAAEEVVEAPAADSAAK